MGVFLRVQEVVLVPTPIQPGQRRYATVQGRSRCVVVEEASHYVAAHWICREVTGNQMFLIEESSFSEISTPKPKAWREAS